MRAAPPRSSSAKKSAATLSAEGKKRHARRNAPSGSARWRRLEQRWTRRSGSTARSLEAERGEIEKRIEDEDTRWQREKQKLSEALRVARD
jgi:hypothetical protein